MHVEIASPERELASAPVATVQQNPWPWIGEEHRVLLVRLLKGTGDPFSAWVVEGVVQLAAEVHAIRAHQGDSRPGAVTIIVASPRTKDPLEKAAAAAVGEAARGMAQSLTREFRATGPRLNVVLAEGITGQVGASALEQALRFLTSPGAAFVAGATLDLRRPANRLPRSRAAVPEASSETSGPISLVTGAGGGIGSAIVAQLVALGHKVIAQDLDTNRLLQFSGWHDVETVAGDLLDERFIETLADRCSRDGLNAIVAAHGIDGSGAFDELTDGRVRQVMRVNASTVPILLRSLLPALRRRRGTFVVVASQAGLVGEPDNAAYSASKFALVGWGRSLAGGFDNDVTIRVLCPGCTRTPLFDSAQVRFAAASGMSTEAFIEQRRATIPVGRFAAPAETAAAAVYLATCGSSPIVLAETGGEVLF